jgi:hypothetical protein
VYVYVKYLGDNIYLPLASMPHPAMSTYLDVTSCPSRFSYSVFSFIRPQGSTQGTVKNIDALSSGNDFRSHFGDRHNLWRLYLDHIYILMHFVHERNELRGRVAKTPASYSGLLSSNLGPETGYYD